MSGKDLQKVINVCDSMFEAVDVCGGRVTLLRAKPEVSEMIKSRSERLVDFIMENYVIKYKSEDPVIVYTDDQSYLDLFYFFVLERIYEETKEDKDQAS